jgi:hypothetical protein
MGAEGPHVIEVGKFCGADGLRRRHISGGSGVIAVACRWQGNGGSESRGPLSGSTSNVLMGNMG